MHNEPRPFCSTTSALYQSRQQQQGQQQVVNVTNTTTTPLEVPNKVDISTNNRSMRSVHSAGMPSLQHLPLSHQNQAISRSLPASHHSISSQASWLPSEP